MKFALFAIFWAAFLFGEGETLEKQRKFETLEDLLRYETLNEAILQDYLLAAHGGDAAYDHPVWVFNGFVYQQNEGGQWIKVGQKKGKDYHFDFESSREEEEK